VHGVAPTDRLCTSLREAEVFDLSLMHRFPDCARDLLDRHIWVNAVLVIQIDRLDTEPFQ